MLAPNQLDNKPTEKLKSVGKEPHSNTAVLGATFTILAPRNKKLKRIKVNEICAC